MKCKNKRCSLESRHVGKCSEAGPYVVNKESVVNTKKASDVPVARREVVRRVAKNSETGKSLGRQTAWQQAQREKYNAKMREYMRKRRAGQ